MTAEINHATWLNILKTYLIFLWSITLIYMQFEGILRLFIQMHGLNSYIKQIH